MKSCAAADQLRADIERNIHDGAQQLLVSQVLRLHATELSAWARVVVSDGHRTAVPHTVLSVNELACDALHIIADTQDFCVRELPGGLTADEKVAVITPH